MSHKAMWGRKCCALEETARKSEGIASNVKGGGKLGMFAHESKRQTDLGQCVLCLWNDVWLTGEAARDAYEF